jgi:hypothetical protein
MAAAPKVSHVSAKQLAADKANLRKARAVAKKLPRSGKQKAASRQNLVRARSAQKARRHGKKYAPAKKPQAPPDSGSWCDVYAEGALHSLPVCAAVAMAASLQAQSGVTASAAEITGLYELAGAVSLEGMCEAAAGLGLAGWRLSWFGPADAEQAVPGLVYGLQLPWGYHAVLGHPAGVVSWGRVLPWMAAPAEAWHLEWSAA